MSVAIFCIPLLIAFYTVVFAIENWHLKNRVGFFALFFLAAAIVILPFFLLFLR